MQRSNADLSQNKTKGENKENGAKKYSVLSLVKTTSALFIRKKRCLVFHFRRNTAKSRVSMLDFSVGVSVDSVAEVALKCEMDFRIDFAVDFAVALQYI